MYRRCRSTETGRASHTPDIRGPFSSSRKWTVPLVCRGCCSSEPEPSAVNPPSFWSPGFHESSAAVATISFSPSAPRPYVSNDEPGFPAQTDPRLQVRHPRCRRRPHSSAVGEQAAPRPGRGRSGCAQAPLLWSGSRFHSPFLRFSAPASGARPRSHGRQMLCLRTASSTCASSLPLPSRAGYVHRHLVAVESPLKGVRPRLDLGSPCLDQIGFDAWIPRCLWSVPRSPD